VEKAKRNRVGLYHPISSRHLLRHFHCW
jgi:hypothetical protein